MCMKFVNVNVQCVEAPKLNLLVPNCMGSLVRSVKAERNGDLYSLGGFSIYTFVNVRGTQDKTNRDNPFNRTNKLCFKVRLTKLDPDKSKQISYDLRDFDVSLSNVQTACFDFVEHIEVIEVNKLFLKDKGDYVVKILVKDYEEEKYDIQMVHRLSIE